jgi:hypothetical protein
MINPKGNLYHTPYRPCQMTIKHEVLNIFFSTTKTTFSTSFPVSFGTHNSVVQLAWHGTHYCYNPMEGRRLLD